MSGFSNKSQIIHTRVNNALASDISISASYSAIASNSDSASYALSSSYSLSGSYALTASYAMNGGGGGGTTTGSFTGSFTGSLLGTASYAETASYAMNGGGSIDTSSFATTSSNTFIGNQIITGSIHQSGTFYPDIIDWISSSIQMSTGSYILTTDNNGVTYYDSYTNIANALSPYISIDTSSLATTGSNTFIGNQIISGSVTISGSLNATSSNAISSSYASTASYSQTFPYNGDAVITGSLIVSGTNGGINTITSQLINDTASIDWKNRRLYSGSNPDLSVDWGTRQLWDENGDGLALVWTNANISDGVRLHGTSSYALSGPFAGTGSNTFNNDQTISGSLTITQNLTVLGSSSITYISQSTLNIGTNLITVNTNTPGTRFGGLAVIDSGSSPQISGSILFDSQNNQWIFVHQNTGGAVTSSVFIQGPQTFNNIGNETTLTTNKIPKATGGDLGEHIGDSNITDNGTTIQLGSNTQVTGSLNVSGGITGSLLGTASLATAAINARTPSTTVLSSLGSVMKAEPLWGGWQNYPGSSYVLVNQRCILQPVYLYTPTVLTGVKWVQVTQGNYTGNNYNGVGLYSYDGAGNLTCVASSSNNANFWSTFASNTMGSASFSFGASYNAAAGLYYIAAVWNQTGAITTNPVIGQGLTTTTTTFTFDFTNSAKGTSRTSAAVTTALPTSVTMANITALQNVFYLTLY